MTEECRNCRFSRIGLLGTGHEETQCRRYAPAPNARLAWETGEILLAMLGGDHDDVSGCKIDEDYFTEGLGFTMWPFVDGEDWCGDWQPVHG